MNLVFFALVFVCLLLAGMLFFKRLSRYRVYNNPDQHYLRYWILMLVVLVVSAPSASAALTDSNEAYYTFDNTNADATGNGHTATINGATYTASGKINGAYDYDGSNDYTTIPNLNIVGDISVGMWLKYSSSSSRGFFTTWDGANAYPLRIGQTSGSQIYAGIYDGSTTVTATVTGAYNTDDWLYLVVVRDAGSNLTVYINGTESVSVADTLANDLTNGASQWSISKFNWATSGYINGIIDEVSIWNRTLSQGEITALFNSSAGSQYPYGGSPPAPANNTYVNLTAVDAYDDSSINVFNATAYLGSNFAYTTSGSTNTYTFNDTIEYLSIRTSNGADDPVSLVFPSTCDASPQSARTGITDTTRWVECEQSGGSWYRLAEYDSGIGFQGLYEYESYTTTNGTIITTIPDDLKINGTTPSGGVTSDANALFLFSVADYFENQTEPILVTAGTLEASFAQAFVSFSCYELGSGSLLNCTEPGPFPRQAGNYTDEINVTGYHSIDYSYEILALQNRTLAFDYSSGWSDPYYLYDGDETTYATGAGSTASFRVLSTTSSIDITHGGGIRTTTTRTIPAACLTGDYYTFTLASNGALSCTNESGETTSLTKITDSAWNEVDAGSGAVPGGIIVEGFYDHKLNITAEDYAGSPLSNFTIFYNSTAASIDGNESDNAEGSVQLKLYQGYNYTVRIVQNVPEGADLNASIETVTISVPESAPATTQYYQFNLTFPSLSVTVYDEETGVLVPGNTTLTFTGSNSSFTKTVLNGTANFNASNSIPSGSYELRFEADGYSDRVYNLTYNRTYPQSLTAYLVNISAPSTIFTLEDRETRNPVVGATITVQRFINGTLTTVNVLESDITGRTSFDYLSDTEYRFQITESSYNQKNFTLNPILFSSYTLLLDPITTVGVNSGDYSGVSFLFSNRRFIESSTNTLDATVSSPDGSLVSYGFNVSVEGIQLATRTGSNAYGSTLQSSFSIGDVDSSEPLILDFYYQKSDGIMHTFRNVYSIEQVNAYQNQTWTGNRDYAGEIPLLERSLVVVIVTATIAALAFTFGGLMGASAVSMVMLGFFALSGFVSGWLVALPIIGLFFVLVGRGSA